MATTQPTSTTPDPTTAHRKRSGTTAALAGATIAAGIGTALVATTPALALISFNHNEALVRSQPRRRPAIVAVGATVAAGTGAALVATTPALALIMVNHNEAPAPSPG